jgi:hypothetical protein
MDALTLLERDHQKVNELVQHVTIHETIEERTGA